MAETIDTYVAPEDYLARERAAETKSEYRHGEIIAMSGASPRHVFITANIVRELGTQLREKPCFVGSSDLRVAMPNAYAYPDVVVVCGKPVLTDAHRDTLANPTLIVEVLSESTADYDRGRKFADYRTLDSLQEYVLVAQDRIHVEHYARRPDDRWLLTETDDRTASLELSSVGCAPAIAEIYHKIEL